MAVPNNQVIDDMMELIQELIEMEEEEEENDSGMPDNDVQMLDIDLNNKKDSENGSPLPKVFYIDVNPNEDDSDSDIQSIGFSSDDQDVERDSGLSHSYDELEDEVFIDNGGSSPQFQGIIDSDDLPQAVLLRSPRLERLNYDQVIWINSIESNENILDQDNLNDFELKELEEFESHSSQEEANKLKEDFDNEGNIAFPSPEYNNRQSPVAFNNQENMGLGMKDNEDGAFCFEILIHEGPKSSSEDEQEFEDVNKDEHPM